MSGRGVRVSVTRRSSGQARSRFGGSVPRKRSDPVHQRTSTSVRASSNMRENHVCRESACPTFGGAAMRSSVFSTTSRRRFGPLRRNVASKPGCVDCTMSWSTAPRAHSSAVGVASSVSIGAILRATLTRASSVRESRSASLGARSSPIERAAFPPNGFPGHTLPPTTSGPRNVEKSRSQSACGSSFAINHPTEVQGASPHRLRGAALGSARRRRAARA